MGLVWSVFSPLLMLGTYTFVFSFVFKSRWMVDGGTRESGFAITLFAGMIVYGLFAECVNRAPTLMISNLNYVKKVLFPLEVVPWVALGSAMFQVAVNVAVLLVAQIAVYREITWTLVLFPLVLIPLALGTIGLSWFLAATGVFLRDIGQLTPVLTTMMLFLAPVFYSRSALPQTYQTLLALNPLTFAVETARQTLLWGQVPDPVSFGLYSVVGLLFCWLGFWWFQRTRQGFADVL